MTNFVHISVLSKELIEGLNIKSGGHYLDATLGGGGHTKLILDYAADVRVTGIDRDLAALNFTKEKLAEYGDRVSFYHGNFAEFILSENQLFDGIIADLGVSSPQLDNPERGFSFQYEAELDMRMDQTQNLTAKAIINHWGERELADIFYYYGEERLSRRIARKIVQERPFQTTTQLQKAIALCYPPKQRHGRINPATRVFQALRIAVNQELESLEKFVTLAPNFLKEDGIIGVISFHSLEDRIVKHKFKEHPDLKVLTKKPIIAQQEEIEINPRARSAKLRLAQKTVLERKN
jgi:16S rRNA (cytosine1402-N4)-methyltransferase